MKLPPITVPRYERVTLATTRELTDLQKDILLLLSGPHTLEHVLRSLRLLHNEPHLHSAIWRELVTLRKHGLIRIYPPEIVHVVPRANVFSQFKQPQPHRRLAA